MVGKERVDLFQSHAGSIEAWGVVEIPQGYRAGFNPTLVRLRPNPKKEVHHDRCLFQSHAGSIEADDPIPCCDVVGFCFNPTLVRLRPYTHMLAACQVAIVSIPRWFD